MDLLMIHDAIQNGKTIFDLKLRVTYYARVSTGKDAQLHSLKGQVDYYTDYINKNPNWTFVPGYVDEGISGTSIKKRENFLKMMDDAKLGKFDLIVTREISRFSRDTIDSLLCSKQLLSNGVGVFFENDNLNTLMPDAEFRLTIMASLAKEEVRKTSKRVKSGLDHSRNSGKVLGNASILGYDKCDGKLTVNEEQASIVKMIFEQYATENKGLRAISTWLAENGYQNTKGKPYSTSTLKNIIQNIKYKGYYCGNKTTKLAHDMDVVMHIPKEEWIVYKDESGEVVPAIVSEELWDRANEILTNRSRKMSAEDKTSYQNKYAYSGKIICTEHGSAYHRSAYNYKGKSKEVWQCKEYVAHGKKGCTMPVIYTAELNEIMRQIFDMIVQDKDKIIEKMVEVYKSICAKSTIQSDIAKLEVEIGVLEKRQDSLLDLYGDETLTRKNFEKKNNECNVKIEELEKKIEDLKEQQIKNDKLNESMETLRSIITKELNFEDGMDNMLVDKFVDRIEVFKTDKEKEIKLKVYVKPLENKMLPFSIKRNRGKEASVCCEQYT